MPARRTPDNPNRLARNAQQSAFSGSVGGRVRSARPTSGGRPSYLPGNYSTSIGAGQIYKVSDGYTDVANGDFLLDLSGQLWWKDDGVWFHLFDGVQSHPSYSGGYSRHPKNVVPLDNVILGQDISGATGYYPSSVNVAVGSYLTYNGSNNSIFGLYHKIRGSMDTYNSLLIGYGHELGGYGNTTMEARDVSMIGSVHEASGLALEKVSLIGVGNDLFGSSSSVVLNTIMQGFYNGLNFDGNLSSVYVIGDSNYTTNNGSGGDLDNLVIIGKSNAFTGKPTIADNAIKSLLLGSFNSVSIPSDSSHGTGLSSFSLIGSANYVSGGGSALILLGYSNSITTSSRSVAIGGNNAVVETTGDVVIGDSNYSVGAATDAGPSAGASSTLGGLSISIGTSNALVDPYKYDEEALDHYIPFQAIAIGVDNNVAGEKAIALGAFNNVYGLSSMAIGSDSSIEADRSWILGSETSGTLTTDETGILVAQRVVISRSSAVAGSDETALALTSDDGTEFDMTVTDEGVLEVGGLPLSQYVSVPATSSDPGVPGQIASDGSYVYVCISDDTWARAALASW